MMLLFTLVPFTAQPCPRTGHVVGPNIFSSADQHTHTTLKLGAHAGNITTHAPTILAQAHNNIRAMRVLREWGTLTRGSGRDGGLPTRHTRGGAVARVVNRARLINADVAGAAAQGTQGRGGHAAGGR